MPEFSLVLPVLDEGNIIQSVVGEIEARLKHHGIDYELVLVENESTDNTWNILCLLAKKNKRIRAVKTKRGYGSAVLSGIQHAIGSYIGYMPSDGQVDTHILPRLWEEIKKGKYDVVKIKRTNRESLLRLLQSYVFNFLARLLFPIDIKDINGSPRIVALKKIRSLHLSYTDSFIDTEFAVKAHQLGWKIKEIPMINLKRVGGASTVQVGTVVEFIRNLVTYRFSLM